MKNWLKKLFPRKKPSSLTHHPEKGLLPKNPDQITYLCPKCKRTEEIPTKVVLHFDLLDSGDPTYPPRFECNHGCNVLMTPLKFTGDLGYYYITNPKTGKMKTIAPKPRF